MIDQDPRNKLQSGAPVSPKALFGEKASKTIPSGGNHTTDDSSRIGQPKSRHQEHR